MNKNRGFANIIKILIVVALAGAGVYFVSTQQNGLSEPSLSNNSTSTSDTVPSLPSTQTKQSSQTSVQTPSQPLQTTGVISVLDLTNDEEAYVGKHVRVQGTIRVNVFYSEMSCPTEGSVCDTTLGAQLELRQTEIVYGANNFILLFSNNKPHTCNKVAPETYTCPPYIDNQTTTISGVWTKDQVPMQWVNNTPVKWKDRYFLNLD